MSNRKPPAPVPSKHAGKWIAWNRKGTKIIATGRTFGEIRHAAHKRGERQPVFEKVPPGLFAGGE